MLCRLKTTTFEVYQYLGPSTKIDSWRIRGSFRRIDAGIQVHTPTGWKTLEVTDVVLVDRVNGVIHVLSEDIFHQCYEVLND